MKTVERLESVLAEGFDNRGLLVKPDEIEQIEKKFQELGFSSKKGYSLPPLDTIGRSLQRHRACPFGDNGSR